MFQMISVWFVWRISFVTMVVLAAQIYKKKKKKRPAIRKIPRITPLLGREWLAALLPWTPSLAAPQGRWCHNNSHKHDSRGDVFLLLLPSVGLHISIPLSLSPPLSPPCMRWPTLITSSATSKISLTQPRLSLQSHYDSLSLSLSLPLAQPVVSSSGTWFF